MIRATKQETARVLAERKWWLSVIPDEWRLMGWTDYSLASVLNASGIRHDLDGLYIQVMIAEGRLKVTP